MNSQPVISNRLDPAHTIAFMGVEGANADLACRRAYPYMHTLPCTSFEDVFEAVEQEKAALGMIPIENSQAGRVAEIHQILPRSSVHIVGEHFERVEHHLLAAKGATLETVKEVYSHPQALMQCRENIRKLKLKPMIAPSTAHAAKIVAEWKDLTKAAISSALAGEIHGLNNLRSNIEDSDNNVTVFLTIAKEPIDTDPDDGKILTSLLVTVRNIPSALYKALGGFATNNINLLKLESYIPPSTGDAQFFIIFEGHPEQDNVKRAVAELGFYCTKVRLLGIYPADPARYGK